MPHALIVAHGQPSNPVPAEDALRGFADRVQETVPDIVVHSATLAAPGQFETVIAELPDNTVIYPLFMARGWFVDKVLPKRLGKRSLQILGPLGTDPDLPKVAAMALSEELAKLGWQSENTDLILAAHGSGRSQNPARVAARFAKDLSRNVNFRSTRIGFVEETPSITEAALGASAQSVCLPFFACAGGHALEDVPQALKEAGFRGAKLPVLGELPSIPAHIGHRLTAHFHE